MSIQWVDNRLPKTDNRHISLMSMENVEKAMRFHDSFPQYAATPLAALSSLSRELGIGGLFVKDESCRFGLNAFKVLGGSYAIARHVAQVLHRDISETGYPFLTSPEFRDTFGNATFFTATDGNHGRGVAWTATQLGQKSVVYMPKGVAKIRFDNIAAEGACVTIKDANYDECVRIAAREADKTPGGVVVQDTTWDGYEEIPSWIMQGYGTMAAEAVEQLRILGVNRPTHIFVQAGVGSLAASMLGYFANLLPKNIPTAVILEADAADPIYRSAAAMDGRCRIVEGELKTIMAGLACGEPNPIAWDILKNDASFFVSCPDWVTAYGMRVLGAPLKGDPLVISGESGAVGVGFIAAIMKDARYGQIRKAIGLNRHSIVLLFSTEGDTDPENYRRILWEGTLPYDQR